MKEFWNLDAEAQELLNLQVYLKHIFRYWEAILEVRANV